MNEKKIEQLIKDYSPIAPHPPRDEYSKILRKIESANWWKINLLMFKKFSPLGLIPLLFLAFYWRHYDQQKTLDSIVEQTLALSSEEIISYVDDPESFEEESIIL